ncbi:MAG: HDIG domain-containing protein [Armatimonadetes bacterium]|nr:HDIG domain-containing protein [Armatimonadota bacterium]
MRSAKPGRPTRYRRIAARRLKQWLRTVETHRLTLGLVVAVVLTALAVLHLVPDRVSLEIGDISPRDIRAPRAASYMDTVATGNLRWQLLSSVAREYDLDPYAMALSESMVNQVFARIDLARTQTPASPVDVRVDRLAEQVARELGPQLPKEGLRVALGTDGPGLNGLRASTRQIVAAAMRRPTGIREGTEDMDQAGREITARADALRLRPELRDLVRAIGRHALRPTHTFSREKTDAARRHIEGLAKPVVGQILPGEPLIHKGETVTQTHLDKFTALGLRHPRFDWATGLYLALLIASLVGLTGAYVYRFHRPIHDNLRLLWLLALVAVGAMAAFKVGGTGFGIKLDTLQCGYFGMLCVGTAAMLLTVLLHPSLAVVTAALLSLLVGLTTNHDLRFTALALVSSLVGVYAFSRIRSRGDVVRSLLILCLTNALTVWVLGSISGDTLPDLLTGVSWGIGSGVFSSLVTWLGVALLERPFGITTQVGLLELADMNQPALRRLLQDAPGTYVHSLNVGQLAEAAAEAIGADTLLARVASYYHDIGKVMRPYCFVENQTVENIHNRLNPTLSTLVVTSHIKDGVELAREYRLPPAIVDIIRSHHGTGLVKYFYHQAVLANDGESPVPEQQFRYEGPRPRTKEAGIIMLADSVEGATRAALQDRPDPARIQAIVTQIIKDKAADGQLDECDLTFSDLSRIAAAFTRILQSIHHARIKYPEALTAEGQELRAISNS